MKDAYSFDYTDAGLEVSYAAQRDAYERIFQRSVSSTSSCRRMPGAMGGSRSEEFLHPTAIGEDTFVRSPGGYAANVEAYETPAPALVLSRAWPRRRCSTPPTRRRFARLVAHAKHGASRSRAGAWTAADTLKNVVLALTHPHGERELVVVGIPGDREIDDKRVEVAFAPAEVQPATDEDFARNPSSSAATSARGRPRGPCSGKSRPPASATSSTRASRGHRVDLGGQHGGCHVHSLVAGRDFFGDGVADVANVRDGDPAPDGSGPVSIARGMEIGHVFQLGRKYAQALGLQVLDENGKLVTVTMGSYGIGVTRILAIIAELGNDEKGLVWPEAVAPFDVHVIATGRDEAAFALAEEVAEALEGVGIDVLYDDRAKVSPGVKFSDAELIGIPRSSSSAGAPPSARSSSGTAARVTRGAPRRRRPRPPERTRRVTWSGCGPGEHATAEYGGVHGRRSRTPAHDRTREGDPVRRARPDHRAGDPDGLREERVADG